MPKIPENDEISVDGNPRERLDVPSLYINGFNLSGSLSDLRCVLLQDGSPIAVLNMSFTTGKTLGETLVNTISSIEAMTGNQIMNMDEVKVAFEKSQKTEAAK